MATGDWIGGYRENGDGSVTWHINPDHPIASTTYRSEDSLMTTTRPARTAGTPKHGFIRGVLFLAFLVGVGVVFRGWLTATVGPESALATSGTLDVVSALVIVALATAALLLSKRRGRTRR